MASLGIALDVVQWCETRHDVMMALLRSRWHADEAFRSILFETRRQKLELVHFERSGARSFWGGCLDKRDSGVTMGRNELGKMLMLLRDEFAESLVTSLRRVRSLTGEMRSKDFDLIRASGQAGSFGALLATIDRKCPHA